MDMDQTLPLYYLSSLAGLGMVLGGIWLTYKQKIYINAESKEVTEIETPIGKFRTNVPALALFALGFVPLIYPMIHSSQLREEVSLAGDIDGIGSHVPIDVLAVVRSETRYGPGKFHLAVPMGKGLESQYKVFYIMGTTIVDSDDVSGPAASGELPLAHKHLQLPADHLASADVALATGSKP
jgi:hypothetical protein